MKASLQKAKTQQRLIGCRQQNIYRGTTGCTNVNKQAQYFYIMTRPRLAPSALSFFCFLSAVCFSLLLSLRGKHKHLRPRCCWSFTVLRHRCCWSFTVLRHRCCWSFTVLRHRCCWSFTVLRHRCCWSFTVLRHRCCWSFTVLRHRCCWSFTVFRHRSIRWGVSSF